MWWRIYFWVVLLLVAFGVIYGYGKYPIWRLADWLDVVTSTIAVIGLYSFVYKKKLFPEVFWKWYFLIDVTCTAFLLLYFFTDLKEVLQLPRFLQSRAITNGQDLLMGIFLSLPMYYALYRLSAPLLQKKKGK